MEKIFFAAIKQAKTNLNKLNCYKIDPHKIYKSRRQHDSFYFSNFAQKYTCIVNVEFVTENWARFMIETIPTDFYFNKRTIFSNTI